MYARYGIPIVFFSTGGHRDYHQVTDEIEYLDFDKYARVTRFVAALVGAGREPRPPAGGGQAEAGSGGAVSAVRRIGSTSGARDRARAQRVDVSMLTRMNRPIPRSARDDRRRQPPLRP